MSIIHLSVHVQYLHSFNRKLSFEREYNIMVKMILKMYEFKLVQITEALMAQIIQNLTALLVFKHRT